MYLALLADCVSFDEEQIADFFLATYKKEYIDNPNFLRELRKAINSLIDFLDKIQDECPLDFHFILDKGGILLPPDHDYKLNPTFYSIGVEINESSLEKYRSAYGIFRKLIEEPEKNSTGRMIELTSKAKIVVLKELGVFELEKIKEMTLEDKGRLFSELLNFDFENAKDYIGNIYTKKGNGGKKNPYNADSLKKANDLFTLVNLPTITK
jgi:hypothetical protein